MTAHHHLTVQALARIFFLSAQRLIDVVVANSGLPQAVLSLLVMAQHKIGQALPELTDRFS